MAIIRHSGSRVPVMKEPFDPDETDWLWFSWDSAPVATEWIVPDGWQVVGEIANQRVVGDRGQLFNHCNGVLLKPTASRGRYQITNRSSFADGRVLDRTIEVTIKAR